MLPRLVVVVIALAAAACQKREDPGQAARLAELEKENRDLRAALDAKTRELAAAESGPVVKLPPAPPAKELPKEPGRHPDDVARIEQLRGSLAEAKMVNAELQARIEKLDNQVLSLMADRQRLSSAEAELGEKLAAANHSLEAAIRDLKAREERLSQAEASNRRLREDSAAIARRAAELAKTAAEIDDLNRRRENYLASILARYREVTELYRSLGASVDRRRSGDSPLPAVELSRVYEAVSMAEEDLKQLRALNAQAARIQKKLAAVK